MQWNAETRYKMLLEINNAVVTRTNREDLFQALAKEVRKHVAFDRMAINLYDAASSSISYFAAADGVQPGGVLTRHSRPLADGAIARMVVQSRQPTIIDDLRRYKDLSSIGAMVEAGLHGHHGLPDAGAQPHPGFDPLFLPQLPGAHFGADPGVDRRVAPGGHRRGQHAGLHRAREREPEPRAREGLPASEQRGVPAATSSSTPRQPWPRSCGPSGRRPTRTPPC